jgi:hypothetical protein
MVSNGYTFYYWLTVQKSGLLLNCLLYLVFPLLMFTVCSGSLLYGLMYLMFSLSLFTVLVVSFSSVHIHCGSMYISSFLFSCLLFSWAPSPLLTVSMLFYSTLQCRVFILLYWCCTRGLPSLLHLLWFSFSGFLHYCFIQCFHFYCLLYSWFPALLFTGNMVHPILFNVPGVFKSIWGLLF